MKVLAVIVTSFISHSLMASKVTVSDYILYEGDTLTVFNSPLEPYFRMFPEQRPKPDQWFYGATKQYTAIYEFKDSVLYLTSIYSNKLDKDSSLKIVNVISDIFKGQKEVKMDWFSTCLVIGTGHFLGPKRVVGNQKDEDFFVIQIKNGKMESKKSSTPRQISKLKHRLFKEFINTPEYNYFQERHSDWKRRDIEEFVGDAILDYTSQIDENKTPHSKK